MKEKIPGILKFFIYLVLAIFAVCFYVVLAHAQSKCGGVQRWDVKTITDTCKPYFAKPYESSVHEENALTRPPEAAANWLHMKRQPDENYLIKLTANLVSSGIEGDMDYHLVLQDGPETMIAEIPDPDCSKVSGSPFLKEWRTARHFIDSAFGVPSKSVKRVKHPGPVTVFGLGLWDKPDHGGGHAKNGREIHPVLKISE